MRMNYQTNNSQLEELYEMRQNNTPDTITGQEHVNYTSRTSFSHVLIQGIHNSSLGINVDDITYGHSLMTIDQV